MICLSNRIVKAIAVVDERPQTPKTFADLLEVELPHMPVIKRSLFSYTDNPYTDPNLVLPDKQGYIDELNRIKVEIAQAKAELRSLGRMYDEDDETEEAADTAEEQSDAPDASQHAMRAEAEAERMLQETRENIAKMMAAYEEEGRKMNEQAKNDGYLEGFDKGFSEAQKEFVEQNNPKVQQIDNLLEKISEYHEEMLAQNEKDLLSLVMTVAQKVIGRELQTEPRTIVNMLYKVLDENRREENVRITVSPDLMPAEAKISAEIKKLITQTAPNALIYVSEDVDEGTLAVETGGGITDLSVETQLDNIKEMLEE